MKFNIKLDVDKYKQLEVLAANDGVEVEELLLTEIEWLLEERHDEIDKYFSGLDDEDEKFNQFCEDIKNEDDI